MNENELYFSYFTMINLIFLFIHVYFCFNFITYANRYIIAISYFFSQCSFNQARAGSSTSFRQAHATPMHMMSVVMPTKTFSTGRPSAMCFDLWSSSFLQGIAQALQQVQGKLYLALLSHPFGSPLRGQKRASVLNCSIVMTCIFISQVRCEA